MHHRLCGPPSIPLSFNLAAVLPRRDTYSVRCGTGGNPPTLSIHRLGRGLPGYLILFAPHAFVPQCQERSREPPSPPAFFPISTHFTATPGIPLSSPVLKRGSHLRPSLTTYALFTPSKSEQRLPPLSYRGCWHRVSRGCFWRYRPNGYPSHLPS
jgi:hypothetical protein